MYIKQLILNGFKTFADKTVINLSPDISVITGPNGVGKSNVYDALRWVTGEQSKKAIRASRFPDVIFSGSDTRKPASFAEVTIVLYDSVKVLNTDLTEVAVTRRLYADGENEYYINGVRVRLRDIQNLFLDTGIGKDFYSFIGQGKVQEIIECKPEERRLIFEEAAGILKYRMNKDETLRKLERTKQDLVRIEDVIREVENQMVFLRKQVKRAQRYERVKKAVVEVHNQITEQEFLREHLKFEEIKRDLNRLQDKIQQKEAEMLANESRISELKQQLANIEEENEEVTRRLSALEKEIAAKEAEINGYEAKIELYESEEKRFIERNKELISKIDQYNTQIEKLQEEIKQSKSEFLKISREIKKREAELLSHREALEQIASKVEHKQQSVFQLLEQVNEKKNQITQLQKDLEFVRHNSENLDQRIEFLNDKISMLQREITNTNSEIESYQRQIAQLQQKKKELEERSQKLKEEYEELQSETELLSREIYAKRESIKNLEESIKNLEGFSRGVKFVLQRGYAGVIDVVANLIKVAPRYELAIEVLLGNKLQNIVIEDLEYAKPIISDLKRLREGRVTFIPYTSIGYKESEPAPEVENMILGYAIDLVKMDDKFQNLKKYLFFNAIIVEDLDTAIKVSQKLHNKNYHIVTVEGDIINPNNVLTGGYRRKETLNIINRKGKLEAFKRELQKKEAQHKEYSKKLSRILLELEEIQETISDYQVHIESAQRNISSMQERVRGYDSQLKEYQTEKANLEAELSSYGKEHKQKEQVLEKLSQELSTFQREYEAQKESVQAERDQVLELQTAYERASEEVNDLLRQRDNINAQIENAQHTIQQNRQFIEELTAERGNVLKAIERNRSLIRSLNLNIKEAQDALQEKLRQQDSIARDRAEVVDRRNELQNELLGIEEQIKTLRREKDALSEEKTELQVTLNSYEIRIKELVEELKRNGGRTDVSEIEFIEEDVLESLRQKRERYERTLQNIGPVNPSIIREYEQVKERHEFLTKQKEDIEQSRESLLKIIREINKKIRQLFSDTFNEVRANFKQNFQRFFPGGDADLVLTDEENLLESGIEVLARLPGKKVRSGVLYSGGEKAMIALALVFAIFMKKPSPFCVLDEVDAALDDMNGKKFIELLEEYKENTQFIVISHKKTTIAAADMIYGVTMEDKGVSKVLSVKLKADSSTQAVS